MFLEKLHLKVLSSKNRKFAIHRKLYVGESKCPPSVSRTIIKNIFSEHLETFLTIFYGTDLLSLDVDLIWNPCKFYSSQRKNLMEEDQIRL